MGQQEKPATNELIRGSIDLMVLSVLASEASYGYLIGQQVSKASGGLVDLKAGTLYPVLHRLEAERLIRGRVESSTGRRRKWYELTAKGRRRLEQRAKQWTTYVECVGRFLAPLGNPKPT